MKVMKNMKKFLHVLRAFVVEGAAPQKYGSRLLRISSGLF